MLHDYFSSFLLVSFFNLSFFYVLLVALELWQSEKYLISPYSLSSLYHRSCRQSTAAKTRHSGQPAAAQSRPVRGRPTAQFSSAARLRTHAHGAGASQWVLISNWNKFTDSGDFRVCNIIAPKNFPISASVIVANCAIGSSLFSSTRLYIGANGAATCL